ncbi:unnamed protein product [Debaryomyces tyrocola]|nr:unnamed protein product [Debaryomyces tyrocola]
MVPEKEILHGFVPNITHYGTSDYTVGVTGAYHPASTPELLPTTPHKVVCGSWSSTAGIWGDVKQDVIPAARCW